jgi:Uncharacterized conserved protein (DUF2285)
VFWSPDVLAATIILGSVEFESGLPTLQFRPDAWPGETIIREYPDGVHLLLRDGRHRHQLWMRERPVIGAPLAVLLPFDETTSHRAAAALRFWRHMHKGKGIDEPKLGKQRLERLCTSLRATDAWLDGASYRTIATALSFWLRAYIREGYFSGGRPLRQKQELVSRC